MSVFIRRFLTDPGVDVLVEIEAVNILDLEPPASITGVGTGTVCIVGEFEDGPFNTPVEVASATDLQSEFGGFGFTSGSTRGMNPCARSRKADGAIASEFWNGNGAIQLSGKKFRRLQIVRADTSVGAVEFTSLAYVVGASAFNYALTSGQTLILDIGGGNLTTTFTGNKATVTGGAFPGGGGLASGFTGGETLTIGYDNADNFTVTFLAADQTPAEVRDRINAYAGFALVSLDANKLKFTGRIGGTDGEIRIVSGSAGVLVALGLAAATTASVGSNVADISAVTAAEVKALVEAAAVGTLVEVQQDGALRISATAASSIEVKAASTATALGFTAGISTNAAPTSGSIPAGTVVRPAGSPPDTQVLVTMQTVLFTSKGVYVAGEMQSASGPWSVKVRHATDDGTGVLVAVGDIDTIDTPVVSGSFSVINPLPITAALSESAIDAAYQTALDATLDPNSVTRECNIIYSARQSNAVRRGLRQNALDASANGLFGRMAIIRSPLGTTKATAQSTTAQPGVGAYRDQRVVYVWPGVNTYVPAIASRGVSGGAGFTPDGNIDVGADGFLASVMSQLLPEENPGQSTSFTGAINGLDTQSRAQGTLTIADYTAFKRAGICAVRMDDGVAIFQSGVTSVDPAASPALVRISRRRMADYIQDSLARRAKSYGKKLSTAQRRNALASEITQFLTALLGKNNPGQQRIGGFTVDKDSGNTPTLLAAGMYRIIINVKTLASLDFIVLATTVGESVDVTETLPAAA